jgi:hypothetical protein
VMKSNSQRRRANLSRWQRRERIATGVDEVLHGLKTGHTVAADSIQYWKGYS